MSQEMLLGWIIPTSVFIIAFAVNFFWKPPSLFKNKADKVQEYETEAIELEPHSRLENMPGLGDVWVARVGIKALGQKAIRNVFVYLTDIDDNQNELFDAPLHPFGQLHNVTGAANINPGETQRFVEILHWRRVMDEHGTEKVNEMGIPYHLTAQLRESNVDLSKSRDRLLDGINVGSHILTLYATGEDTKDIERHFKVDIVDGKLEVRKVQK